MNRLVYLARWLANIEKAFLTITAAVLILTVFYAFLARYVFEGSIPAGWADVFSRFLLAILAFIGSSMVFREGGHFSVNVVVVKLRRRAQLIIAIVVNFLIMVYSVVLVKETLGILPLQLKQKATGISGLPLGAWPLLFFIMLSLITCYLVYFQIKNFREILKRP